LFEPNSASAAHPVPVILRTHGWGGSGEQAISLSGTATKLLANGYAVITWDSRGFGQSGGEANVDDPNIEGRDASKLIDLLAAKSLASYGAEHPVKVPTLLMQGSVDTLFNLNEAWANFQAIAAAGAPVKMIAFCGGHVSCPSGYDNGNAREVLDNSILQWF